MYKVLAIIPARGGSKRIPKKNIREFLGKPIIAYSIEAAINSGLFEEVMVSTDSEEIARTAERFGAKVPFLRSAENSDDFATTADVLLEVIMKYKELGKDYDYFCCIYPIAPLIQVSKLRAAYEKLLAGDYDSVYPVQRFSYPIQRALKIEDDKIRFFFPEYSMARSQDLEPAFKDAGQFYWIKTTTFLQKKSILTDNSSCIILKDIESEDIDTLEDWEIAEMKYKLLKQKGIL